jgi:hypothetical protein
MFVPQNRDWTIHQMQESTRNRAGYKLFSPGAKENTWLSDLLRVLASFGILHENCENCLFHIAYAVRFGHLYTLIAFVGSVAKFEGQSSNQNVAFSPPIELELLDKNRTITLRTSGQIGNRKFRGYNSSESKRAINMQRKNSVRKFINVRC